MKLISEINKTIAVIFFTTVILFTAFYWDDVPMFLYNELEARSNSKIIELEQTNEHIETLVRKKKSTVTDEYTGEQLIEIDTKVLDKLKIVESQIGDLVSYISLQEQIPGLPPKYREYRKLKREWVTPYIYYYWAFRTIKEREAVSFAMTKKLNDYDRIIGTDPSYENMRKVLSDLNILMAEAKSEREKGTIDNGYVEMVKQYSKRYSDLFNLPDTAWKEHWPEKRQQEAVSEIMGRGYIFEVNDILIPMRAKVISPIEEKKDAYLESWYDKRVVAYQYAASVHIGEDRIHRLIWKLRRKKE